MIFPIDVQKNATEASKMVGFEKFKVFALLGIMANIGIAILLVPMFTSVGLTWLIPIGGQVLIMSIVTIFVIRVFVIKEDEKMLEYEGSSSDSFAKFFYLRDITNGDSITTSNKIKVPVYEFDNGTVTFVMRFRFGSNDDDKAEATKLAMEEIYKILGRYNLEHRAVTAPEDFTNSPEAMMHMDKLNQIKDPRLAKFLIDMAQEALDFSEEASLVNVFHLQVKTRSNYQRYDLDSVVKSIVAALGKTRTAFRSYGFLDDAQLQEFIREFYTLEVMDLSLMKVRNAVEIDSSSRDILQVHKIVGENGKFLVSKVDGTEEVTRVGVKL